MVEEKGYALLYCPDNGKEFTFSVYLQKSSIDTKTQYYLTDYILPATRRPYWSDPMNTFEHKDSIVTLLKTACSTHPFFTHFYLKAIHGLLKTTSCRDLYS